MAQSPLGWQMIGGIGTPGERITRRDTVQETFVRIRQSIAHTILYSALFSLTILLDMLIIGWEWGGLLGGEAIIILAFAIAMGEARKSRDFWHQVVVAGVFLILMSLWPFVGERWLPTWWPLAQSLPPRVPYNPWYVNARIWVLGGIKHVLSTIPLWLKVLYYIPSTVAKFILGFGAWAAFVEMIDPSGPTSPRKAIVHAGVLYPWERWIASSRPTQPAPPERTIRRVQVNYVDEANGQLRWNEDIPDDPRWIAYCKALGQGAPFSEPEAAKHGITGSQYQKVKAVLIEPGHLDPPWVVWRDEENHLQGLAVTEVGRQVFAEVGEIGKPEEADTPA